MRPEQAKNVKVAFNAYGMERKNNDDEEDEDEDTGKRTYMAKLPCGQIRNRCSYNAAYANYALGKSGEFRESCPRANPEPSIPGMV